MSPDSVASLLALLREREGSGPGLIFVGRRREAEELAEQLTEELGYEVAWVTAQRPLSLRKRLAQQMKDGQLQLAVCTSTWSTGLDIPRLRFVVLTGRDKAPIGVLQEVGRALRVHGEDRFEIINLVEPGLEHAAQERMKVLIDQGFETEESFLDELEDTRQAEAAREPTTLELLGLDRETLIYSALMCLAGGTGLYLLHLVCGGLE